MYSFFSSDRIGNILILSGKEVKHYKVRRIQKNENFIVIHEGKLFVCKVHSESKYIIKARIIRELEPTKRDFSIKLFIGIPGDLKIMDNVIRYANETGIDKIVPILTSRGFNRKEIIYKRIERWKRIAVESSKQAFRPEPIHIDEPVYLGDIEPEGKGILFDSFGKDYNIKECLKERKISAVIGPEGGLSSEEVKILKDKGFQSMRLKPYILRVETAVAVVGGIFSNLYDI